MASKFPAFKPLSGIYKETWAPYKKFSEGADMSVLLEVDGNYYRILRNTLDWKRSRKMLVCREDGQIENDVDITRKCFNFFVYLDLYDLAKQNMKFDQKQADKNKHEPLIQGFQTIIQELKPILSHDEREAMAFHLYYLEEVYRLSVIIAELASKVEDYRYQLKNLETDRLSAEFMNDARQTLHSWRLHRKQVDSILIEDGERARPLVKKILKKRRYKKEISNWGMKDRVLKEMKGADYATKRYIKGYEKDHELIKLNLGISKGSFAIESLIEELHGGVIEEQKIAMYEKSFLGMHWALSKDCIFK